MSAATSPGTGTLCLRASSGSVRPGVLPVRSFYAMKSRQQATAERPPAKRRGPKPSISDEALLVAIEADLEASPWEGEGHRKLISWARLRVCRGIRVSRKRVLRVMRENNLLSPHRCRRRGGNPSMSVRSSPMPPTSCGARTAFGCSRVDDAWGWIFTAIEHWNARVRRLACVQARRPLRRPSAGLSMGLARLYASTSRRCGAVHVWPCGWITAPSICRTTSPTRSSSGASSRPTPSSNSPRPTASPRIEVQSHAQGTDHPWPQSFTAALTRFSSSSSRDWANCSDCATADLFCALKA